MSESSTDRVSLVDTLKTHGVGVASNALFFGSVTVALSKIESIELRSDYSHDRASARLWVIGSSVVGIFCVLSILSGRFVLLSVINFVIFSFVLVQAIIIMAKARIVHSVIARGHSTEYVVFTSENEESGVEVANTLTDLILLRPSRAK